ncbi:MAG: SOS response-associated peptidase family protein [Burkholderiales bacterium]
MCYSAQVWADYKRYVRDFGALLSIKEFFDLFWRRKEDPKVKIPKGMEMPFADASDEDGLKIKALIDAFAAEQATKFEQEVFKQRKRLADAERVLASKPTKAAAESQRIATSKIEATMGRLSDLRRSEPLDRDARIFPGVYAPVMVMENSQRVIKPMRYQCRPAGKPAFYDTKFPGTYNARRDNLEGFWKDLFGFSHGLMVVNAFYENVNRHRAEGRELRDGEEVENRILEFRPRPTQDMLVACLWSRWSAPGEPDLLSFAAITDEPPPEVSAAGHDRCIIPIKPEHIDAWLNPDRKNLAAQYAILDDRERPYYEHRLAA